MSHVKVLVIDVKTIRDDRKSSLCRLVGWEWFWMLVSIIWGIIIADESITLTVILMKAYLWTILMVFSDFWSENLSITMVS